MTNVSLYAISQLVESRQSFEDSVSIHYDEVVHNVSLRIGKSGDVGKEDIGALLFWKRLSARTRWVPKLMSLSDDHVRDVTRGVVSAARDTTFATADAATEARRLLSVLPGFMRGDALASAVIFAAAPERMAVYDQRAQEALEGLGFTLTARPGRYGRYIQLLEEIRGEVNEQLGLSWRARDVDVALYQLGA